MKYSIHIQLALQSLRTSEMVNISSESEKILDRFQILQSGANDCR